MTTADTVTILQCKAGIIATKRWSPGPDGSFACESYGKARSWHVGECRVGGIEQLANLLDRLAKHPRAIVIRGAPLPGVLGTWGRRLEYPDPKTGDAARFEARARYWCALDFDKVATLVPFDVRRPDHARAAVQYLRSMLSTEFRSVACYATLTSSAGFGDPTRVSARLWFWLDRPVSDAELTAWARATNAPVDVSLFRAVQAHYVAAPIFVGMEDPIERRAGVLLGAPAAVFGTYETPRERPVERLPYVPRKPDHGSGDEHGRRYARATLEQLGRELASAPEGDRHRTVHAAARRAGGLVPGGWLTRSEIHDELSAAARASGLAGRAEEVARTISDGIDCGAERWPWDPPARGHAA